MVDTDPDPRALAACALRRQGITVREIRSRLAPVSYAQVHNWLRETPPSKFAKKGCGSAVRERARELRREGWLYREIAEQLEVSEAAVCCWVRDLPAPARSSDGHSAEMMTKISRAYWGAENARRDTDSERTRRAAAALVGPIDDRTLLMLGAVAYWCEGTKAKPWRQSHRATFVNSDLALIRLFLVFLDAARRHGVQFGQVTYRVAIHESADVSAAQQSWAADLGIDPGCLQRPTLKRHNPRTPRHNIGPEYRGCMCLDVKLSGQLYVFIEGLMRGVASTHPDWQNDPRSPGWCRGSTADFDSASGGPNPPPGAAIAAADTAASPVAILEATVAASPRSPTVSNARPAAVVVLAAGEGTRMRSKMPKVLHAIAGQPLLAHVLAATAALEAGRTLVVVGHGRDQVAATLAGFAPNAEPVVQGEQHGTGHAVRVALDTAPELAGTLVVVPGDTPLLTTATLQALLAAHAQSDAAATLLTAVLPDPAGYGRVLRNPEGEVTAIVEHRDATPEQREIREVGTSVYAFDVTELRGALSRLRTDNGQGEQYLTDVVGLLAADGQRVGALTTDDPTETWGVNDRVQLARAAARLRDRLVHRWLLAGVSMLDPQTVWVDPAVRLEPDVTLHPNVQLYGHTEVERGAQIGPNVTLTDTIVRAGATVANATCVGADIGARASVGPYTYLRPGTRLGAGAKAGGFVEMKNAEVGEQSKVPHLSYVGDVRIGARSNVGATTVVVNYDGRAKHQTQIGDDVRIGSDTMLVAPVSIGDGAYTAAGSVITEDVPPGAMAVARGRQRNVEGWVERKRPDTQSARSAQRAREQRPEQGRSTPVDGVQP